MPPPPPDLPDSPTELLDVLEALSEDASDSNQSELHERYTDLLRTRLDEKKLHLGPAAMSWLQDHGRGPLLSRLRSTTRERDAILGAVYDGQAQGNHPHMSEQLRDEFWGHISTVLQRLAGRGANDQGRSDLIQSAIASVLASGLNPNFYTEAQFLKYLQNRMGWKSNKEFHRRRDNNLMDNEAAARLRDERPGPATRALENSLLGRVGDWVSSRGRREQYLIVARIQNIPMAAQADHLGLSTLACRKASQRAWKTLKEHFKEGGRI